MGIFDGLNKKIEEDKKKREDLAKVRGKQLGFVMIGYIGGFDPQYKPNTTFVGALHCYENMVNYQKGDNSFSIPVDQIVSFEVNGNDQRSTSSRLSVTRMATLGVFSLAAPKRKTTITKDTSVIIGLKDGRQVFFHTKQTTEYNVHRKLVNAISYYRSLQPKQPDTQLVNNQVAPVDNAAEIMKYAELKKQGILTQEEFDKKKAQLLDM